MTMLLCTIILTSQKYMKNKFMHKNYIIVVEIPYHFKIFVKTIT